MEGGLKLEVIGAGFGRTGTVSTREAFKILGVWPNYHMAEAAMGASRTIRFMVWVGSKLGAEENHGEDATRTHGDHIVLWEEASIAQKAGDDKKVKELLVKMLAGFKSTLDYPAAIFYKELLELCPDAKVVLTIRDSPEAWAKSITGSIGLVANYGNSWYHYIPSLFHGLMPPSFPSMLKHNACGGDIKNWKSTEWLCSEYNRHIAEVKANVPADKLVVFNVKEGWKPLCQKLGKEVQEGNFPRLNDSANIKKNLRFLKFVDTVTWGLLIAGAYKLVLYANTKFALQLF